ncbi:Peptidoglycan/LPS O-acetylase OafA/YrhL, contains acyltransferase and SGNH-hydrolase domains [Halopseudomonas sabulinigri]|uniref:Peptidoglycan/LPS O-acetylase OafA/YrhL, contains acyltransferase and SGNH-hydrolase domains n=1 Tax=Halopseudomonas sabulinigri TaxID=472181 RepID=A0A1H1QTE6_9GAMM|nr:acyltransferase family protein [Halopseudomonas sabulinigri]SDS26675.1 Peptidoglycan/LPS O-acetylase OafA/YrhL, contains acyltransferase and SGNH-hydrolase domains [Halopseudomonas sabulinigri]
MNSLLGYRRDIDGLRAIAVLPVVLFHLGVAPFSGGFVGVDVFFVISGFLITSIVYREQQAGTFSYARFYERRIRRLFPALAVMLLVTGAVAWFVLLPEDYKLFSEAQGLSVLFLANIHFWNKTDYFNDAVANIPLLHTWSLSVEEQFYLLFPPLLLLLVKRCPKRVNLALFGLAALSLLAAQKALSSVPESAFYLVHLRAWELLAGALLATGAVRPIAGRWLRESCAFFGLGLIAGSVFLLDKQTAFPGLSAVPAVLGAALIIHAGASGSTLVGRLLGVKALVFLGLISYSLYLWHWPLFVFAGYYQIEPLGAVEKLGLFILACLLGWLSWRYVESPFRRAGELGERRRFFRRTGWVAGALILISLPGTISKGAAFRLPDAVAEISAVEEESIPFRRPCFGLSVDDVDNERNLCVLGDEGDTDFLLWGDSHALSLAHGYDLAAKKLGLSGRFLARSECPPALGSREYRSSKVSCGGFNEGVVRYLERHPEVKQVVLVGVWSSYFASDAGSDPDETSFSSGLVRTVSYLSETRRSVALVEQVPLIDYSVPQTLARVAWYGRELDVRPLREQYEVRMEQSQRVFDSLAEQYALQRINLADALCDAEHCNVEFAGRPLYRDTNHLSKWGATMVVPRLVEALKANVLSREESE